MERGEKGRGEEEGWVGKERGRGEQGEGGEAKVKGGEL